jgi:predicted SnoaL-like aldol condensation-catalyzing enzyme
VRSIRRNKLEVHMDIGIVGRLFRVQQGMIAEHWDAD